MRPLVRNIKDLPYSWMDRPGFSDRFWSKVDRSGSCWEWRGERKGYGVITIYGGGSYRECAAHRVAYALSCGRIPAGKMILHSCDNKGCVNPAHLRPGTAADNRRDALYRWRGAKFSRDQIDAALGAVARGTSMRKVARQVGCSIGTLRNWKHGKVYPAYAPPSPAT